MAPILPQEEINTEATEKVDTNIEEDEEMDVDLQKELEAKFDELFGSVED